MARFVAERQLRGKLGEIVRRAAGEHLLGSLPSGISMDQLRDLETARAGRQCRADAYRYSVTVATPTLHGPSSSTPLGPQRTIDEYERELNGG